MFDEKVEQSRRRGEFQGEVIGPIGAFLKVVPGKEDFAALAEHAIGGQGILDRFIVTNGNDGKTLRRLRQEARCGNSCGVLNVRIAPRYRIPSAPQAEGVDLVAGVFAIENDIVFNALVDHCVSCHVGD